MQNGELIKSISDALNEVREELQALAIKVIIDKATRAISRISGIEDKRKLLLKVLVNDLNLLYAGEVQLGKINGTGEVRRFSESFFRSFAILKDQILNALGPVSSS
jgi:hypothetical protein